MNQPHTPDISFFFAVHRHMRSDLDRYLDSVSRAVESERSTRLRSLHRWVTGFICELEAEHHRLDEMLQAWPQVSAKLADPAVPFARAKSEAVELANQLRELLAAHLDIEDHDVLPLYWRHYTASEYDDLQALAVKKSKKKGLWFVAP